MVKITPVFYGETKDGKLVLEKPERYQTYIKSIGNRKVVMVLKTPKKPRSLNQNDYYWAVVVQMIADETGFTPDEAHEAIKWLFLRKQLGNIFTVRSTSILNTIEFENYVEQVRIWAQTELNIKIPLPNEIE
jgi:hypothetical protein